MAGGARASTSRTEPTGEDVAAFLDAVEHPVRRRDAHRLVEVLSRVTGQPPRMWGPSIVGFGSYHYRYDSGREGDMCAVGFSPRKAATTVYLVDGVERYPELLERLGPHTTGKSCLYVKDLEAVDLDVLEEMVRRSYTAVTS
ncbi:DUF1801 domain-containing protein [Cellulosimicrobium sp. CUA-896]|uniref:DUF1801 domain-containing protein n=1 Tax=Cellulosimicrobium sp. CUA-896 TaxID=1517881 RepID=UPI000968F3A8|nr:DUF1801 domain-containing protein [Cellulosimicrobium sp. CUA-896]OLT53062.1 hypothetical protein BJF88_01465 [Cellulosimicrobium sp. CUA-896]